MISVLWWSSLPLWFKSFSYFATCCRVCWPLFHASRGPVGVVVADLQVFQPLFGYHTFFPVLENICGVSCFWLANVLRVGVGKRVDSNRQSCGGKDGGFMVSFAWFGKCWFQGANVEFKQVCLGVCLRACARSICPLWCHQWNFTNIFCFWTRELELFEHGYVCWTSVFVPFCVLLWSAISWSYLRKFAKRLYTIFWLFGDFVDRREHWRLLAVRFNKYATNTFCSRYPFIELQPWPTSWSRRQVVICDSVENQVQLILMCERSMIQFVKQEHEMYYNLNSTDEEGAKTPLNSRRWSNCPFEHGHHCRANDLWPAGLMKWPGAQLHGATGCDGPKKY